MREEDGTSMIVRNGQRRVHVLTHRAIQIALVALAVSGFGVMETFAQG